MKFLVILLFYCYSLQNFALGEGCFQPVISFEVLDSVEANTQILTYEVPDIRSINNDFPYFDAKIINGNLTISTTDEFFNLEKDYANNDLNEVDPIISNGELVITVPYTITCMDATTNSLQIIYFVTDTNNNEPILDNKEISCKVPMPIMAQTDLTLYGCKATAWDLDLSNSDITDSDDFDITTTQHKTDSKNYLSYDIHIKAKKTINYDKDTTFNIDLKDHSDSYSDTKTTSLKVTIEVDNELNDLHQPSNEIQFDSSAESNRGK